MSMNENRVPQGVPTGGQFAASIRDEASTSLDAYDPNGYAAHGFTTVDACEQCGSERVGHVMLGASGGTPVPGSVCRMCGDTMPHWEQQSEDGTYRLWADGNITFARDGDQANTLVAERGDDEWDEIIRSRFAYPDHVEHAFAERDREDAWESGPDED